MGLLLSVPMSILLARTLGPSGKGTLSIIQTVATLGAVLLNFGISASMLFYGAKREARGRDAVALALLAGCVASGLALLAVKLAGPDITQALLHTGQTNLVVAGAATVGVVLAAQILGAYVMGTGSIKNASMVNVWSLAFQLGALLLLWRSGNLTPVAAVAVWIIAVFGTLIAQARFSWNGQLAEGVEPGVRRLVIRAWRYAVAAWPGGILGNAALRADVFLLAYFANPAAVGVYSIAVTLAELCWYIPNSLGGVLAPKVASEGIDALHVTLRIGRVTWVITGLAAICILIGSTFMVPLLFGSQFAGSVVALAFLLPGIVATAFASAPSAYLNGIGRPGDWTRAAAANVAVNITANIVLIPRFGVVGAAAASSLSYSTAAVIITMSLIRQTKVGLRELVVPTRDDLRMVPDALRAVLGRFRT